MRHFLIWSIFSHGFSDDVAKKVVLTTATVTTLSAAATCSTFLSMLTLATWVGSFHYLPNMFAEDFSPEHATSIESHPSRPTSRRMPSISYSSGSNPAHPMVRPSRQTAKWILAVHVSDEISALSNDVAGIGVMVPLSGTLQGQISLLLRELSLPSREWYSRCLVLFID